MKNFIRILFVFLTLIFLHPVSYSQSLEAFECGTIDLGGKGTSSAKSAANSEHGWYLTTDGVVKILIIYAEADYSNPNLDPRPPGGSALWPENDIPTWASDVVDEIVLSNPQGYLSKYYDQASSGNLKVIGDFLLAPTNNGIFTVPSSNLNVTNTELTTHINSVMNGNFLTNGGVTTPGTFDNWLDSNSPGAEKVPMADPITS